MKHYLQKLMAMGLVMLLCAAPARALTSVYITAPSSAVASSSYYVSVSGSDDFGEILDLTVTRNGTYWASNSYDPWDWDRYNISVSGYNTAPGSPGSVSFYATMDTDSTTVYDSDSVTITAETTPPSVPAGLGYNSVTMSSFNLTWSASTDNVGVTGYEVKRDSTSLGTTASTSMGISGLSMNTLYSMTVRARDAAGNWSAWSSALGVTTANDTTPPSTPTGLSGSSITMNSFTLSWSASSDNVGVTAYEVMRDVTSLGTTGSTSMGISGLASGTYYAMKVRARDAVGNWSGWSSVANISTTADTTAPSTPTGLSGSSQTLNSFTLSWSASSDNVGVTAYEVKRDATSLGTVGTASKSVTGLTHNTSYGMTVRARDAAGNWSSWSSAANISTLADTTAPSLPTGLTATSVTVDSFTLNWSASTDDIGVTSYEVFRDSVSEGTTVSTSMAITGLTASTLYEMQVKAGDAANNWSSLSTVLEVTATNLTADDDGDGLTNGEELELGTDPNDKATSSDLNLEVHRP